MLPIAWLPMLAAYTVWTALGIALLFLTLKRLEADTKISYGNWPMILSLTSVPVIACMLHGQFSILILAAYVLVYSLWKKDRRFLGGLVLSIVTLKFQLVIGFVAVLLLRRKGRELAGFACGSAVLLAISILIAGIPSLMAYPHFVLHSDSPVSELSYFANWEGLVSLFGHNHVWLVVSLSIVTVLWAAWSWKKGSLDRGFCGALLASMLVSYHSPAQDLTLLIIPFFLCARAGLIPQARIPLVVLLALLIPLVMVIAHIPLALLSIPIAATLWWVGYKKFTNVHATA